MSPMPWLSGKRISQMVLGSNPSWSLNLASFATSCIHIEMIQYVMCSIYIHRRIWHCVQGTSDTMAWTPQTCGCEDLERYTSYICCLPHHYVHWTTSSCHRGRHDQDKWLALLIFSSPDLTLLCLCLSCSTYEYLWEWQSGAEPSKSLVRKCCSSQFM